MVVATTRNVAATTMAKDGVAAATMTTTIDKDGVAAATMTTTIDKDRVTAITTIIAGAAVAVTVAGTAMGMVIIIAAIISALATGLRAAIALPIRMAHQLSSPGRQLHLTSPTMWKYPSPPAHLGSTPPGDSYFHLTTGPILKPLIQQL